MGERIRNDIALCPLLQPVVAYGGSGTQCFFDIAWFKYVVHLLVVVRPQASVEIGLQFEGNGEAVSAFFVGPGLELPNLIGSAHQVLDMMTYFVCDHIGHCEVAAGTEAVFQFLEEREIEVNLIVGRAIERAYG